MGTRLGRLTLDSWKLFSFFLRRQMLRLHVAVCYHRHLAPPALWSRTCGR